MTEKIARRRQAVASAARQAVEAVAQRSYGTLVALLSGRTRDPGGAEDAVHSAFEAALVDWPASGVPRNPVGWLLTVARRKWIDAARRRRSAEEAEAGLRLLAEEVAATARAGEPSPGRAALAFVCAHPVIEPAMRAPLLLQAVLGFEAAAIAPAFRISPAAMSQRLVRTKRKLRAAGAPCEPPDPAELEAQLEAVREVLAGVTGEA
jgi:RNA polymerase sigma-70 factor (ECF subfamily)